MNKNEIFPKFSPHPFPFTLPPSSPIPSENFQDQRLIFHGGLIVNHLLSAKFCNTTVIYNKGRELDPCEDGRLGVYLCH